jgi:hypothetical protein
LFEGEVRPNLGNTNPAQLKKYAVDGLEDFRLESEEIWFSDSERSSFNKTTALQGGFFVSNYV